MRDILQPLNEIVANIQNTELFLVRRGDSGSLSAPTKVSAYTHVVVQALKLLDPVMTDVQLFEVVEPFQPF